MKLGRPNLNVRTLKMALATALCALIYELCFEDRSPAFACIGAIFGMGESMEDSRQHGGNRLFGTIIGGVLGMALFRVYLIFMPHGGRTLWLVPIMLVGTVLLMFLCQIFWEGGVQPGGVILCILLFNTPVDTYVSYAVNRIIDTAAGVLIAWGVSYFFPRTWLHALHVWEKHVVARMKREKC